MDRKTLLAVILIIGGGMLLSHYSYVFEKELVCAPPVILQEPAYIPSADISAPSPGNNNSFADVVQIIEPALVNISAVHIVEVKSPFYQFYFGDPFEDFFDFFGQRPRRQEPKPEVEQRRQEGTGSGFIVGAEGYVLTNHHVIRGADELKVTTHDGKVYEAELVGEDPMTDLAVIKIKSKRRFNALKLGKSDSMRIGDWVIAAGSPFGLNQTFTVGIISALRQDVQVENVNYRNMIQTDAAINRGNSGGPLVNLKGEVIGINSAIFAPTGVFAGIGFAIPIDEAMLILDELIEKGRVVRGWLGVEIADVDDAIKKQFSLDTDKGVLINRVVEDAAADKAGLKRGDIIISFNGEVVEGTRDLQKKVSSTKPKTKVSLEIVRSGEKEVLEVTLGELTEETPLLSSTESSVKDSDPDAPATSKWLGISVSEITGLVKERYSISSNEGVVVTDINPKEEGYSIGLRVGDLILEFNRKSIASVDDFEKAVSSASLKEGVVLDIVRSGRPLYISYHKAH